MENTAPVPTALIDPILKIWIWLASLVQSRMTIQAHDQQSRPLTGLMITDQFGNSLGLLSMAGTCRCRQCDRICVFDMSGTQLLLLQPDGGFDYWLNIPKGARLYRISVQIP